MKIIQNKKSISLILVLILFLSIVPSTVYADNNDETEITSETAIVPESEEVTEEDTAQPDDKETETIAEESEEVYTNSISGMPPEISPRSRNIKYSYNGRYVSSEGYPIANAKIYVAFCYQTGPFGGGYMNDLSDTTTNTNGEFQLFYTLSNQDIAAKPIYVVLLFPKSSFGGVSKIQILNQATTSTSGATASAYSPRIISSKFNIDQYGIFSSTYDGFVVGEGTVNSYTVWGQEIHIGGREPGSSGRQEVSIGLSVGVQTKITENYYIEGESMPFDSNSKVFIDKTYSYSCSPQQNIVRSDGTGVSVIIYEYTGFRVNTTTGALQTEYPIIRTINKGNDVVFNYYYRLPGAPPIADVPTYAGGSATSVNITGTYNLNGGTYIDAWLEKSQTSDTSGFTRIGGISDGLASLTFAESNTLIPNTIYWYRTCIQTDKGTDTSAASVFTTLPRIDTITANVTGSNTADISGDIALGSESITDVEITYDTNPGFTQNPVTINGSSPGVTFGNSGYYISLTGLTAGQHYYVKIIAKGLGGFSEAITATFTTAGALIDITVPSGVEFYATPATNGIVTPDTARGQEKAVFQNNSELPVKVSFEGMTVNSGTSGELTIVNNVNTSTVDRRLHLDLIASADAGNCFTGNVSNIIPNSPYATPVLLGILDGTAYTASGSVGSGIGGKGIFEVGGQYVGDYPINPLKYNVDVTFRFRLEIMN